MELRQYLRVVIKWLWLIVLSAAVAAGSTYLTSRGQAPVYSTKTTLIIGRTIESAVPDAGQAYMSQQLALTYAELVRREPVLRGVVESLNLNIPWNTLVGRLSVKLIPQTQLMEISVIDTNPYRAKAVADAAAQQLILLTPEGRSAQSEEQQFAQEQLTELKTKIDEAKKEIERLTKERDAAISARRIQDLQTEINTLQSKLSGWQNTYSQLLIYLKGGNVNVIRVVEEAAVPTLPIGSDWRSNVMLAAAIGVALALGGAFLIEYMDDSLKSREELEQRLGLPTLGVIARVPKGPQSELIVVKDLRSRFAEGYRMLRANLRYALPAGVRGSAFLVTSIEPGEGKTTIASNLAVAAAQAGQRVILVDADLRQPSLHEVWNHPNDVGLTSLLVGEVDEPSKALQASDVDRLLLLPSGPTTLNAPELLASPRMAELVVELTEQADLVIIDTAPLLAVSDTSILAGLVTGTLLVVEIGRTRMNALVQAVDMVRKVGGVVIGTIINRQPARRMGYYYHYYDYKKRSEERKRGWLGRIALRFRKS